MTRRKPRRAAPASLDWLRTVRRGDPVGISGPNIGVDEDEVLWFEVVFQTETYLQLYHRERGLMRKISLTKGRPATNGVWRPAGAYDRQLRRELDMLRIQTFPFQRLTHDGLHAVRELLDYLYSARDGRAR